MEITEDCWIGHLNPLSGAWKHTISLVENLAGDRFQSVILQRVQLVTGSKNICARIEFQLEYWDHGVFE